MYHSHSVNIEYMYDRCSKEKYMYNEFNFNKQICLDYENKGGLYSTVTDIYNI